MASLIRAGQKDLASTVRFAIDSGVNYLDLAAAALAGEIGCARLLGSIGRALEDGYRQKVKIALTVPAPSIGSPADAAAFLERQREWLGDGPVDFLVLGGLNRLTWARLADREILPWAERAVARGLVGELGFSFHDDYQTLRTVLDASDAWTLARFRYSFMDVDHHPGIGGPELAAGRGLAVVVAQPLLEGRLVRRIPGPVARVWTKRRDPAQWTLRWVMAHPHVSTVVVDVASIADVIEDVSVVNTTAPNSLSIDDEVLVSRVRDVYRTLRPVLCTGCRSCLPCPRDIDIPLIFELYNEAVMYRDARVPRAAYPEERHRAEMCDHCGICATRCGMGIAIPDRLSDARQKLN